MTGEEMERAIEFLTAQAAKHDAQISQLIEAANQDGENIRSLARIAEIHERRITRLEGGEGE
jgi:hypothetical protein